MKEASSRILLDRTVIRLDGRPFFSFGPRLFLTPSDKIPAAIQQIAQAGFTTVATPPASRGNLPTLNIIFDECEKHDLLVVLIAERRLSDPSDFLATEFKHRRSLHSYCLPPREPDEDSIAWFTTVRDRLRAQDLFHPIWMPYGPHIPLAQWIASTDLHSAIQGTGGPFPRHTNEHGGRKLAEITRVCAQKKIPGRPLFCHSFQTYVPDSARHAGVYNHDHNVRRLPANIEEWYPFAADLDKVPRHDFLPPDPELLRLRVFELLASRARGIILSTYDWLTGPSPFSGNDRFYELAILAQEIAVCHDFFAEGQNAHYEVETGHPRFKAALLRHSADILLLLWASAPGEEFWIDPAPITQLDVSIRMPDGESSLQAWRVDFPHLHPLTISYDLKGAIRIHIDNFDLTAKVLLTSSSQRPRELKDSLNNHCPKASEALIELLLHRVEKLSLIERELDLVGAISEPDSTLSNAEHQVNWLAANLKTHESAEVWKKATETRRALRGLINRRMIATLSAYPDQADPLAALMRQSYYTLPQFHREKNREEEAAIQDFT